MIINNENRAYEIFAEYLMYYACNEKWDKLVLNVEVYYKMVRCFESMTYNGQIIDEYREMPDELSNKQMKATFFLRDDLQKLTGDRIWGLTFTLYPDGKFEIEYDYNKPEDYEETDEVITGEEINQTFLK